MGLDLKAMGIMALIIAALFFVTLKQQEKIGTLKAEVAGYKVADEWREKLADAQKGFKAALEAKDAENEQQTQEIANERDGYRNTLQERSYQDSVGTSDYIADQLDCIMQQLSKPNGGSAGVICAAEADTTGENAKSEAANGDG